MSLLNRRHLADSQLAEIWANGGDNPHLAGCGECRGRYQGLERWLAGIGDELRGEADTAFPVDRLSIQQAQIARRLETLERPARVIAFPKAARAVISGHSHVRRWVTMAAAASLIAGGFGLGQMMPLRSLVPTQTAMNAPPQLTAPQAESRAKELTPDSTSHNDDELLTNGFARTRVTTLSALDEMTPRARDVEK